MARRVRGALASLAFVVTMAGPARAHYVQSGNLTVWSNGNQCVKVQAALAHSPAAGRVMRVWAHVETEDTVPFYGCNRTWRRPANQLRLTFELRVHKPTGTYVCRSLGYWHRNSTTADHLSVVGDYGRPCGKATYSVRAVGQTLWNGAWRGGGVNSGGHYF